MLGVLTILAAGMLAAGTGTSSGTGTGSPPPTEEEALISAAVVYNIARFSTWAETPDGRGTQGRFFEVCYEPGGGMADALATIAGKDVGGRPVRPVPVSAERGWSGRCHVYLAPDGADADTLSRIAAGGTLTVGRGDRFWRRGGAVRLRIDGKPRFSVNVRTARAAGVQPSSKLLRLAEEVIQ